jgi:hypothetical protein
VKIIVSDLRRRKNHHVSILAFHNDPKFMENQCPPLTVTDGHDKANIQVLPVSVNKSRYVEVENNTTEGVCWAHVIAREKVYRDPKGFVLLR